MSIRYFLFTLTVLALVGGTVSAEPIQPPPGPPCGPTANFVYDCPDGPGWIRITGINIYGEKQSKQLFVGSRQVCLEAAAVLRQYRSKISSPVLMGVCTNVGYLVRWQVDGWANMVALPQLYYKEVAECRADAAALNQSAE